MSADSCSEKILSLSVEHFVIQRKAQKLHLNKAKRRWMCTENTKSTHNILNNRVQNSFICDIKQ